jgi:hypothetical protein
MSNEYICLVRSKKKLQEALQYFPKPDKTLILGQNVRYKTKPGHFNRMYIVNSLVDFIERYPIKTNNHLHEVIPNSGRLVKPYIEVTFYNFDVKDEIISETRSRLNIMLDIYMDHLKMKTYMEPASLEDWTISEIQTIKDGGLNSHFVAILNNGYYFRNNKEQKQFVEKIFGETPGINMKAYEDMYQLLLCNQTPNSNTTNTMKHVYGDVECDDYLFVLRYHRLWEEEFILEKRKTKRIKRKYIKKAYQSGNANMNENIN